jgi:two-component system OmpR family response regulator
MRVLVVEDEIKMARAVRRGLEQEGYAVDVAGDGDDALFRATEDEYDAIVLDLMLPGIDGFELCRSLRARGHWAPVLMLTARDAVDDRIRGLDVGADDYLVKPFAFGELLARLRALIRRGPNERPSILEVADVTLDPAAHRVARAGRDVDLSAREFSLLEYLMRSPGRVLTRRDILEHVWDYNYDGMSNVVDVYVGYLRKKLEHPFETAFIHTVRGVGYVVGREEP